MKKLLFILALIPFIVRGQTPESLVDLSEYHNKNRLEEMTDKNFTDITEGGYQIPLLKVTDVEADSIVTRVLNYEPPHGAMNFADSATVIALTQNVWTKVTGPAGDLFMVRITDDITIEGDSITIQIPGDYMLWVSFSFDGVQNANFHIALYKNGAVTDWEMHRKTSAQDTGNAGMPTYIQNLIAGDDLSIWIENTGNDGDATMVSGQIVILMIHPR